MDDHRAVAVIEGRGMEDRSGVGLDEYLTERFEDQIDQLIVAGGPGLPGAGTHERAAIPTENTDQGAVRVCRQPVVVTRGKPEKPFDLRDRRPVRGFKMGGAAVPVERHDVAWSPRRGNLGIIRQRVAESHSDLHPSI